MLSDDVTRYVALYRRLGRSFAEQSRTLHLYVRFAEAQGDSHVRTARIHDWCAEFRGYVGAGYGVDSIKD